MEPKLTESGREKSMNEDKINMDFEKDTAKMSDVFYLALAAGAVALSLGLAVSKRRKNWANFVGQWAPTFLLLGIYDKFGKKQKIISMKKKSLMH